MLETSHEKMPPCSLSEKLYKRALEVIPGGVHSPVRALRSVGGTPIFFRRAYGPYLETVEGRRLIDFCMSFGPSILGHRPPEIQEVVMRMVDMAWTFGACEPYSLELAEWVTQHLPWVGKIRFVSSGTEAVMSALRVARAATGRNRILKFDGCYHGHVDSLLVKSGSGLAGEVSGDSAGLPKSVAQDTLAIPLNDLAALEETLDFHGRDIAAMILEPLPANYGLLIQDPAFIIKACELVKKAGALVIFDEVITGFRLALGGMAEVLGIRPDLVTYGKVLGGGFPIGAFGGRRDLMDLVAPSGPVYQAGTFSANPIGVQAGLRTLQLIKRDQVHAKLKEKTEFTCRSLNTYFEHEGLPMQASWMGSLFWIHSASHSPIRSVEDIPAHHKQDFARIFHHCLQRGVYLAPSGFEVNFMSMAHDEEVLEQSISVLKNGVKESFEKTKSL